MTHPLQQPVAWRVEDRIGLGPELLERWLDKTAPEVEALLNAREPVDAPYTVRPLYAAPISPALVGDEAGKRDPNWNVNEALAKATAAPRLAEVEKATERVINAVHDLDSPDGDYGDQLDELLAAKAALLALLGPAGVPANEDLRPEVLAFARLMEAKLRKHDAKRGQSWKQDDARDLFDRLTDETKELRNALDGRGDVADECADVANFAMMVADQCGGLGAVPANGGSKAENLLLGLHKIVSDLGPYFDKPITEESMPRWLALDSAQKAVAAYFGVPAKEAGEDGR